MDVRAKKRGFFGGVYRKVGDIFDGPSDRSKAFSKTWMEKVTKSPKKEKEKKETPKPQSHEIPLEALEIPDLIAKEKAKEEKKLKEKE